MAVYLHEGGLKLRQKVRAIVVSNSGQFLLVRPHGYEDGEWTLAGGGVEQGETPHQAMRREISEELGVTLEEALEALPVSNRFIYEPTYKTSRNLDHDGQHATMFIVRLPRDTPLRLQAEEVVDARWFSLEKALGAFPVAKQREVFAECVAGLAA
ncbi:NUDIX hydrolase [Altererythrobacter sp. H2]|uniref:NUDIX hydrolase n=1 Tax=Altererythrobacter sp. H2 TaxID=3108391 RepID=UPI002B4C104A|nr:NUDIX hydrolase [Altererythrobacter sp. H2]WRK96522.1 NUDIX hydrolase [Altererythrobacter sp. H2]